MFCTLQEATIFIWFQTGIEIVNILAKGLKYTHQELQSEGAKITNNNLHMNHEFNELMHRRKFVKNSFPLLNMEKIWEGLLLHKSLMKILP